MNLTVKKFDIPSEMVNVIESGKDPLPTDLVRIGKTAVVDPDE